jgi:hypothetical protein
MTLVAAIGGLIAVSALFPAPSIWDAETATAVGFAELTRPWTYLIGAPLFGAWDSLSLLTVTQHYALLATCIVGYTLLRLRARSRASSWLRRAGVEVLRATAALGCLLLFYAGGALLPRPMVGLHLGEPDLVSIDFHSHTKYSHDGWRLFPASRNRAWHEAGGFDVAYVTDHYTWEGFEEAQLENPARVGDRTTLLSGAEIRIHLRPTNILGERDRYLFALDSARVYMSPDSIAAAFARGGRPPTLLYTMPGGLRFVIPFDERPSGVVGIELNDGSPRGLEQVKAERAEILALADSMNLAVVGAANLHGWGRTAAAWSVMEVPGWQELSPGQMGDVIEAELHEKRRDAVRVVERRMPYHDGSWLKMALTVPWLTWEHFRMLAWPERLSWLAWAAGFGLLAWRRREGSIRSRAP